MDCKECYKFGHCWACVLWFGCSREKPEDCFRCGWKENGGCSDLQKEVAK